MLRLLFAPAEFAQLMSSTTFAAMRNAMVDTQLAERGIKDAAVLGAMREIPREDFVPAELIDHAYDDAPVGIGCDQTISQPLMVALMTQALQLSPTDRVLEVGTGSGYQTAVLARLADEVYTVEQSPPLAQVARTRLQRLGFRNITFVEGDGTLGWPDAAPYDAVIVTAGAPELPKTLLSQLGAHGRMVVPVGSRKEQMCKLVQRTDRGTQIQDLTKCRFVPLLGAEGWKEPEE